MARQKMLFRNNYVSLTENRYTRTLSETRRHRHTNELSEKVANTQTPAK